MHKVFAIAALGLLTLTLPAFAVVPANVDVNDGGSNPGGGVRSIECPGTVVFDTGMYDEFTPPTGCSTAGSAGCFINAINDGAFPADGRRIADDFFGLGGDPITQVKVWARFNQQGDDYHRADPSTLHGFCVKFYAPGDAFWCPDGSLEGEEAIGPIAYDQYCSTFQEEEVLTGLPRQWAYCISLPQPFYADYGVPYWVSVSADFDFTSYGGGVTQWFWRVYPGVGNSNCETMWWDTWNTPNTNWNAISVALNIPCWAGWDSAMKLYAGEAPPPTGACCIGDQGDCRIMTADECANAGGDYQGDATTCEPDNPCTVVPTQDTTWGKVKANYR